MAGFCPALGPFVHPSAVLSQSNMTSLEAHDTDTAVPCAATAQDAGGASAPAAPSPADEIVITADRGVLKTIVTPGKGEVPPLHARCLGASPRSSSCSIRTSHLVPWQCDDCIMMLGGRRLGTQWQSCLTVRGIGSDFHVANAVHYIGRLAASGEVFLDTRAESQSGEPIQLVAGRGAVSELLAPGPFLPCTESR